MKKLTEYTFTFEGADFPTTLSNLESGKVEMAALSNYEVNAERQEKFVYGDVGYVVMGYLHRFGSGCRSGL